MESTGGKREGRNYMVNGEEGRGWLGDGAKHLLTGIGKLLLDPRTGMKLSLKCLRCLKMKSVNSSPEPPPPQQFMQLGL